MAWYRTGTATFTNGSKNVTGASTAWVGNVRPGDEIVGPDGLSYEVETVTADGALTMVEAYAGTTTSGASYKVKPIQGWNRDVAAQLAQLLADYSTLQAALTALSNGDVGIGTPSPAAKLHVNGPVRLDVAVTGSNSGPGGAAALPSAPSGYALINIGGLDRKVPYYP